MAAPFLVRVLTSSVMAVGRQMGRLSAISTLGSVAGTVLIGYVLIPFLPNSVTLNLTAFSLMAIVGAYFVVWGRGASASTAAFAGLALGTVLGYGSLKHEFDVNASDAHEIFRGNSNFGLMQVVQNQAGDRRFYLNDFLTQNIYDPVLRKSVASFTYMLHGLAHAYMPRIHEALCIGMGVGIVPMLLAREGVRVDLVEINPAVVPVAQKYFDFDPQRVHLIIGDGRYILNRCAHQYDAIFLDAFLGDSSPSHLLTRQAFQAMRQALTANGVLVINSFGDFKPGHTFFCASLDKTLRSVFASVLIHDGGNGNVYFVASAKSSLQILSPPDLSQVHPDCVDTVRQTFTRIRPAPPGRAYVLTDDYNPVEFYDAGNREHLRKQLARNQRLWKGYQD
jgi:predicted membrane-bound spermidine synthase